MLWGVAVVVFVYGGPLHLRSDVARIEPPIEGESVKENAS